MMADLGRYKRLGFMCGLEIHQRLATESKLFCSCSASLSEGVPEGTVTRRQRAVAGELGVVDRSAKFEEKRSRLFEYELHEGHACLVDIDEEPPHSLNEEALGIALALAKSLHMNVGAELEPMRKEVVDGSNPSAFQRSILIGLNGSMEVGGHEILIPSMFLEEESAGIISSSSESIRYDTSRIGIPLVEIDTFPYISSPEEARDVALQIGTLLRLTGKVQRGIGSIRQDVNVSIKGGARVEIKGLQELSDMDKFIENEVARQEKLLEIIKLLKSRNASVGQAHDLTHVFSGSHAKIISAALGSGGAVLGFKLGGFSGVLGMEVNPGKRLGTEISDYAKMGGVKGLIHSDEDLAKYGITQSEIGAVRKALGMKQEDAFIIIADRRRNAAMAIEFAIERAKMAVEMVPEETRAAYDKEHFTTRFMRPLPGGSRMYPETDAKPIRITKQSLEEAARNAVDVEKEQALLEAELNDKALAKQMMLSPRLQLYRRIGSIKGIDKRFVANVLLQRFTEMRRDGINAEALPEERLMEIFKAYSDKRITKQALDELIRLALKRNESIAEIIRENGLERISGERLRKLLKSEGAESCKRNELAAFMGKFMSKYRLNVDGAELNEELGKIIGSAS